MVLCSSELVERISAIEDGEVFLTLLPPNGLPFGHLGQVHGWSLARGPTALGPATLRSARMRVAIAGCFGSLTARPGRRAFCTTEIVERKKLPKEDQAGSSISGWAVLQVTTGRSGSGSSEREIVEQMQEGHSAPQLACSLPVPVRSFGNDLNTRRRDLYCRDSREEGEAWRRSSRVPCRLVCIWEARDFGHGPADWCKMGSETRIPLVHSTPGCSPVPFARRAGR